MDYSWSANFKIPSKIKRPPDSIWAIDTCDIFPLTDDQLLVRGRTHGRATLVASLAYQALSQCTAFNRNSVHLANMLAVNGWLKGKTSQLQEVIDALKDSGVITTASEVVDSLNHPPPPLPDTSPVNEAFITTCDRPQALERLLGSAEAARNDHASGDWKFTVVDDSRQQQNIEQNRKIVEARQSSLFALEYHGPDDLARLSRWLKSASPGLSDSVSFLTRGLNDHPISTYGAARNRALLLAADRDLIMLDDDILLQRCGAGEASAAPSVGESKRSVTFLERGSDWRDYVTRSKVDPLTEHGRFLGRSLHQALGLSGGAVIDESVLVDQRREELRGMSGASRIVLTTSGVGGDPGMTSNRWLLELGGEEKAQLLKDASSYDRLKQSRSMILAQSAYAFRSDFILMSTMTGVHNRLLMPPYFPHLRNEDFLFGKMVQFLYPRAVVLDQPWFVPHLPVNKRRWGHEDIYAPEKMGFSLFLGLYINRQAGSWYGESEGDRFDALIAIISDLGAADSSTLVKIVRNEMAALATSVIRDSGKALSEFADAPEYWKLDVQKRRDANIKYLSSLDDHFLVDLSFAGDLDKQVVMLKSLLQRYAKALSDWREIRALMTLARQEAAQ